MVACAADDHLNLIATAATSDGGMEEIGPTRASFNGERSSGISRNLSSRVAAVSSCVHLWDAEMMTLVGTLPLPSLALTRDLANAATAFASTRSHKSEKTEKETTTTGITGDMREHVRDQASPPEVGAPRTKTPPASQHAGPESGEDDWASWRAVRAKASGRPVLITALQFLSPFPLLAGCTTGGAVLLWRTTDCVCVQVGRWDWSPVISRTTGGQNATQLHNVAFKLNGDLRKTMPLIMQAVLLPLDLSTLRGRRRDTNGATAEEEEEHLTSLARSTRSSGADTGIPYTESPPAEGTNLVTFVVDRVLAMQKIVTEQKRLEEIVAYYNHSKGEKRVPLSISAVFASAAQEARFPDYVTVVLFVTINPFLNAQVG